MATIWNFGAWLKMYTGLTIYDFDVLSKPGDGTEEELQRLYEAWKTEEKPTREQIAKAKGDLLEHGFVFE